MSRVVFALVLSLSSASFAQIIFQPVRYEYGNRMKFYYGGSDPVVVDRALSVEYRNRRVYGERGGPMRVYSDAIPGWNAALFGFTPDDARNEANNNVPRVFRMRDLVAAGALQNDGSIVVPAHARPSYPVERIVIMPSRRVAPTAPGTKPATSPNPILIIPKELWNRKVKVDGNLVAMAK
jgi:hypothetical protein